jgi:hypothetical protein
VACSFEFGFWAWHLEASHFGHPSQEAMGVHGQRFGLCAWTRFRVIPKLTILTIVSQIF